MTCTIGAFATILDQRGRVLLCHPNLFSEHAERIRDALNAAGTALLRTPVGPSAPEEIRRRNALAGTIARRLDETDEPGE
jgi:hypothetical protein